MTQTQKNISISETMADNISTHSHAEKNTHTDTCTHTHTHANNRTYIDTEKLASMTLSPCRGKITRNAELAKRVWFKCAGKADILFEPKDEDDLITFLNNAPKIPITVLGAGSNVLISDSGIRGLVVILSHNFTHKSIDEDGRITAGAALGDGALARFAQANERSGLEFYAGIPGTIGGAVRMNAGAEGVETKDRLLDARICDLRTDTPKVITISNQELQFAYRASAIGRDMIVLSARFETKTGKREEIARKIAEIKAKRKRTQPIDQKTGGSTFKNPLGDKAWLLIERAGMRGARIGGAKVSEKHCNFLINHDHASANDIMALAKKVRARVKSMCGVQLEWEIVRLGWYAEKTSTRIIA